MDSIINANIWILVIEVFSFATYPLISIIFKGVSDKGFAVSKLLGILVASYIVWLGASLHIFPFTRITTTIVSLLFLGLCVGLSILRMKTREKIFDSMLASEQNVFHHPVNQTLIVKMVTKVQAWFIKHEEYDDRDKRKRTARLIFIEEVIFLTSFFIWTFLRGTTPSIIGTEKFMDFGIMNALLKSSYFPPHDMWLSGFHLNYYYYGQYIYTFLTSLSGIPSNFAYNYSIPTIFALTFLLSFSFVFSLTKKLYAAFISGCVLTLAGNLHFVTQAIQYFFQYHNLNAFTFWYPSSTRLIPFTINEFPIYSFIVSDLHAHVTDIPIVLVSLIFSLNILNKKVFSRLDLAISGLILGIMAAANSWDALLYAFILFCAILGTYLLEGKKKDSYTAKEYVEKIMQGIMNLKGKGIAAILETPLVQAILSITSAGIIGILLFLPFYIGFKAPVDGIGVNTTTHSDPTIELLLFGFFFFFVISFAIFLMFATITKKKIAMLDLFILLFMVLGIGLIIAAEIFYLKDIFYKANPPYFRANTVFKLYYQSWILFSVTVGYVVAKINSIKKNHKIIPVHIGVWFWNTITAILLFCVFLYTFQAINEGFLNVTKKSASYASQTCIGQVCFNPFKTDDGTQYIQDQYPNDYAMINWLNEHANQNSVIAEAVGDSYTYFARISANTGLSTVLGWPNHQYQWRNTYTYSAERITDISDLYTSPSLQNAENIVKKYGINYIIVGDQERTKYPNINEAILQQTGKIVFQSGGSYIISVR